MDTNGTTTANGSDSNGVLSNIPDVILSPSRQESFSESLSELNDDTDIETMRQRIHEMEEEAEKLKQMQFEVDKQMQSPSATGTCKRRWNQWIASHLSSSSLLASFPTMEEKMEADQKSVYVGNVSDNSIES